MAVNAAQGADGKSRHHHKRQQHGAELCPIDVPTHADGDKQIGGQCQQSRECGCLGITRQQHGQHDHDENAEAETGGSLDETGDDAKRKDEWHERSDENSPQAARACLGRMCISVWIY